MASAVGAAIYGLGYVILTWGSRGYKWDLLGALCNIAAPGLCSLLAGIWGTCPVAVPLWNEGSRMKRGVVLLGGSNSMMALQLDPREGGYQLESIILVSPKAMNPGSSG